jgi:hypothetical protein
MRYRACGLFFVILFFLLPQQFILAQTEEPQSGAILSQPDLDRFPTIQVYMDVFDSNGNFIQNLTAEDVYLIEDDRIIDEVTLEELRPGLQLVVVVNPGLEFARRNSQAVSRYDILLDALKNWLKSRAGTTIDDISLLVTDGPNVQHTNDYQEVLRVVEGVNNDARESTPNLDSTFQAIELAADPVDRSGMGRAVLLITPPLDQSFSQSIENLAMRAREQGVRVFVWMVGPNDPSILQARERLSALAQSTRGAFYLFSGEEALPFPEDFLDPLREIYSLTYQTQIRNSGVHTLSAEITHNGETITAPLKNFEVNIQSPVPAFIKPPVTIRREIADQGEDSQESASYNPESVPLQIVVDFPDSLSRGLTYSALYVDGLLAAENNQPPFDQFLWDVSEYTSDSSRTLRVEVTDQFGLTGSSIDSLVYVTVEQPVSNWIRLITGNIPILAILAILMAGALIFLVLILGGKIKPHQIGRDKSRKKKIDPLTQPVPEPSPSSKGKASWTERLQWPQRRVTRAFAYLTPLEEIEPSLINQVSTSSNKPGKRSQTVPPFPIQTQDTTIGRDPARAILLLTDPSVDGLHARLTRSDNGSFTIVDESSAAGTWVNFMPVERGGIEVQHGDIIHIGRSGFRFTLRRPGRSPKKATIQAVDQRK